MIWTNLYLCFLMIPIGSDLSFSIIKVIDSGDEKDAIKLIHNVECFLD